MKDKMRNEKELDFSSDEQSLLDVINSSCLSLEDVKWLKSKRWFKRFIKVYAKELKKRYKDIEPFVEKVEKTKKEDIEILDFTQSIKIPPKEIIEILDFTKTIDIKDVKDISVATNNAKKKIKIEKTIWSIIIGACSAIILFLIVILVNWHLENKKTIDVSKEIYEIAEIKEIPVTTKKKEEVVQTTTTTIPSDYVKYRDMNMLEVNFDNLKSINPDTKGWIKVEGTKINYPFVQSNDNEYYLKHSYDKTSNKKGWVYLDYRNNIDNLSKNTILYAHGLTNNTMFGSMRNIVKQSWFNNKSNHVIKVSTPTNNQLWQVFSVYTIEPESYYIITKFGTDIEYSNFIQTIKSRSLFDFGVDVITSDKILTLSSCYDDKKRMVLHAKLINAQAR